jgi:hypothetical protein
MDWRVTSAETKTFEWPAATLALELGLLFLVSVLVRSAFLEHHPIHDELQHLLAARSWAEDGSFSTADGEYTRGGLYTILIGVVYKYFGDSIAAARWSSVIVGSLWVVAVFWWARYRFDSKVAWVAAMLFCFAPGAIFLSQYVRFYVLHGLLFWIMSVGTFELLERTRGRSIRFSTFLLVSLCFVAALHLQQTTLVGLAGIALYTTIRFAPGFARRIKTDPVVRRVFYAAAVAACVIAVYLIVSGAASSIVDTYRWAPAWAAKSGFLKYHWMLVEQYPLIWGTLPVAAVIVVFRKSLPGLFCVSVFGTALVLHSFAGMKAERLIYYVMPFFFILGAILLTEILSLTSRRVSEILERATPRWKVSEKPLRIGVVSIACIALLISNPALRATADMLRGHAVSTGSGGDRYWTRYDIDWDRATLVLQPMVEDADIVLSTNELHMLYYLDRADVVLSFSRLSELIEGDWQISDEFKRDFRTGRPVISAAESVALLVSCFESGLIVVRDDAWSKPAFIPQETRRVIEAITSPDDVLQKHGLRIYNWRKEIDGSDARCRQVQALVRMPVGEARSDWYHE